MDDIAGILPGEDVTSPPWGELGRVFTLGLVSAFSKTFLNVFNTTEVWNRDALDKYVINREPGVGLLTVCNHTSTFDDPGVISAMLPWSFFLTENMHRGVRWTMCAQEICYSNWFLSHFFRNGKVLPIDRKGGVEQPVMSITGGKLAEGDWVHLFPEGRVSFSGALLPCRKGVGKLVCDYVNKTGSQPIVLPFYHSGMGEVKRRYSSILSVGHEVTVNVGEPITLPIELCEKCGVGGKVTQEAWSEIAKVIETSLADLERASPPNIDQPAKERHQDTAAPKV